MENLIIIGSGPAGLTAGIYTGRANLKPITIQGRAPGGAVDGDHNRRKLAGRKANHGACTHGQNEGAGCRVWSTFHQ